MGQHFELGLLGQFCWFSLDSCICGLLPVSWETLPLWTEWL